IGSDPILFPLCRATRSRERFPDHKNLGDSRQTCGPPSRFLPNSARNGRHSCCPYRRTWLGRRDHALLLTFYNTGARVSELRTLRQESVSFGATASLHLHGKGRKDRQVPLWSTIRRQAGPQRSYEQERRGICGTYFHES